MPHDSHTTHEPDRVGREGDEAAGDEDISRRVTLLDLGRLPSQERELAPAAN